MEIVFDPNKNKMSDMELCQLFIKEFLISDQRRWMLDGEAYYVVDNPAIMNRKMYRYEEDRTTGEPKKVEDKSKPNNKRAHGYMHLMIEDKVNYLLSKPYSLTCESEEFLDKFQQVIGRNFQHHRLERLGVDASNGGIAWLHPYINESGEFKTIIIKPGEVIPMWHDNDHEDMDGAIWFYNVDVIEGHERKTITKVEYWTPEGVAYYESDSNEGIGIQLRLDAEKYLEASDIDGDLLPHFRINGQPANWERVPFIPFKNNDFELPDLKFVKTLIDAYDKSRSDIENMFDELKSSVYALKGYGGQDLGQFMKELNYFRAIELDDDGSAEVLNADTNITPYKEDFDTLKKDIYEQGQAVDKNSDKLGNSPSGIALKFMYSGLDLKCNRLESAFKVGMEVLKWFVCKYMELTNQGKYYDEIIDITFNRDIAINESQAILDCQNSKGIISDETIIKNHPWTEDVEEELDRMKAADGELPMFDNLTKKGEDE